MNGIGLLLSMLYHSAFCTMQGNVLIIIFITSRRLDYVMHGKDKSDKPTFHATYHVTAITFLLIGIIATGIFGCTLVLNQNHTAMAQQQQQQQPPTLEGISFQI